MLHRLTARALIRELEEGDSANKKQEIVILGMRYNLASMYTSFVAVEERDQRVNEAMELRPIPTKHSQGTQRRKSVDSVVSSPYNVTHQIHVDFNSSTGFVGLPPDHEQLLNSSGITHQDVTQNAQDVVAVLKFATKPKQTVPQHTSTVVVVFVKQMQLKIPRIAFISQ